MEQSTKYTQNLRLGRMFTFQHDNDSKHTAKTMQEWLWDKSENVLEWSSKSQDLNPIKHRWRELEIAIHQHSTSNLTELESVRGGFNIKSNIAPF